jgi:hypothetical protein
VEVLVAKVLDSLPAAGEYGPEDKRLAADLVRFSVMTLDLLEFVHTAQEKREAFRKINCSLGDRLQWLYTALIAALKELPEVFDDAEKNRIIGAFLSVCTLTHDVLSTPSNRTWQTN